jgi:hypothetical protein
MGRRCMPQRIFHDALMTWELIAKYSESDVSLMFYREFDQNIEIGTYHKGPGVYASLTYAITG